MRIHACAVGLLRICEGILPMDMNNGHNFLSPEKFVRNVRSDVSKTGISVEPTGSVT